jgi:hypothetical protein
VEFWIRTYIDATLWGELVHAVTKLVLSNAANVASCLGFTEHPLSNPDGVLSSTWSHWQQGICFLLALFMNITLRAGLELKDSEEW